MVIEEKTQYINLSKLAEYNNTIEISTDYSMASIHNGIFYVFYQFPILQWFSILLFFIVSFIGMRYLNSSGFIEKSDIQILNISAFLTMAVNTFLLIFEVFNILQPLELMFIVWLITILMIVFDKSR